MGEPAAKIERPTNFDQLYPGRFLKAGELKGRQVTLTIKEIRREELHGEKGPEMKATMVFEETEKQLVACKTNGLCLKAMFGATLANWVGKRVTIFPTKWGGDDCIRVYGSPDIDKEFSLTITLPRKRPFEMVMHKIAGKGAAKTAAKVEPPADEYIDPGPPDDFESREPGTEG